MQVVFAVNILHIKLQVNCKEKKSYFSSDSRLAKKNENGELLLFSIAFAKINSTDLKLQISLLLFLIAGSVFLERDLNLHNTFGQIFDNLNKNENYLNGTRVDFNIQYAELDQFDAYQKACMEMTYRY